jgi:hypothetical protein
LRESRESKFALRIQVASYKGAGKCELWLREAEKLSSASRDVHFELAKFPLKKDEPAKAAIEGEAALGLSDGTVTDSSIHYFLIRAYRQSGMPERAAQHAEIMRAQETPAKHPLGH